MVTYVNINDDKNDDNQNKDTYINKIYFIY